MCSYNRESFPEIVNSTYSAKSKEAEMTEDKSEPRVSFLLHQLETEKSFSQHTPKFLEDIVKSARKKPNFQPEQVKQKLKAQTLVVPVCLQHDQKKLMIQSKKDQKVWKIFRKIESKQELREEEYIKQSDVLHMKFNPIIYGALKVSQRPPPKTITLQYPKEVTLITYKPEIDKMDNQKPKTIEPKEPTRFKIKETVNVPVAIETTQTNQSSINFIEDVNDIRYDLIIDSIPSGWK